MQFIDFKEQLQIKYGTQYWTASIRFQVQGHFLLFNLNFSCAWLNFARFRLHISHVVTSFITRSRYSKFSFEHENVIQIKLHFYKGRGSKFKTVNWPFSTVTKLGIDLNWSVIRRLHKVKQKILLRSAAWCVSLLKQ